ncbi:hypothetical protein BCR44DRAFT_1068074 [Catenaria anguillulae PL171]|uniref:TRP C-terminal domain-containing protein n=1 Tax=Catenaria anguillulae PL171 TaxID=765915 RepID=A0A1Y2HPT0_9FUNG|nr:hypothetical protein BCR44DRAFT_1068074 [Catenaria anguillulae PL171]
MSSNASHPSRLTRLKTVVGNSQVARIALMSSVLQMVVQIILEVGVAYMHIKEYNLVKPLVDLSEDIFKGSLREALSKQYNLAMAVTVYHVIYMLATVMQLYITVDSVLHQNSIELIALNVINLGLFGYSIVQLSQSSSIFGQINSTLADLRKVPRLSPAVAAQLPKDQLASTFMFHYPSIVISLVFLLLTAGVSYKLHQEYGWAIYKRIGADIGLRRQMMHYFFLMMLLKLDVFFYFTFSLQFLVIGLVSGKMTNIDIAIHLVVALTMIVVLIVLCVKGTREENDKLMFLFMAGTVACMGYLCWKLYQAFFDDRFIPVQTSITFSIGSCLLLAVLTLVNSFICYRNFGTGLKSHVGRSASMRRRQERAGAGGASAEMGEAPQPISVASPLPPQPTQIQGGAKQQGYGGGYEQQVAGMRSSTNRGNTVLWPAAAVSATATAAAAAAAVPAGPVLICLFPFCVFGCLFAPCRSRVAELSQ